MAKRVVGTPISVQEHRETLSATVDVKAINEAVAKSADVKQPEVEPV